MLRGLMLRVKKCISKERTKIEKRKHVESLSKMNKSITFNAQ